MQILDCVYAKEDKSVVFVTTTDSQNISIFYPSDYFLSRMVDEWISKGNVIKPWVDKTNYMTKLETEMSRLITEIFWRVERNQTQKAGGFTPSDDDSKMEAIYTYLQGIRDMDEKYPDIKTKEEYEAIVWPPKPE